MSHCRLVLASAKVSEPTIASIAQSITEPLGLKPPSDHWKRKGRSRLRKTWKIWTNGKFFEKRKKSRLKTVMTV